MKNSPATDTLVTTCIGPVCRPGGDGDGAAHPAALVVFVTGMGEVSARATTPFEVMTGTLVVLGVCVVLVVLGRITGLAAQLPLLKNSNR